MDMQNSTARVHPAEFKSLELGWRNNAMGCSAQLD